MSELAKKNAALKALELVEDGMILGLGTGSTAAQFIMALGAKAAATGWRFDCVATSMASESLARQNNLTLVDPNDVSAIDLAVDGADEADARLRLIKGGGAALLREKIVAAIARRFVVIADESKLVARLGKFPLPIEVIGYGASHTAAAVAHAAAQAGCAGQSVMLRLRDGAPIISDNASLILDLAAQDIPHPEDLAQRLSAIPGVVEHGLFIGMAERLILGSETGARTLLPGAQ